MKKVAFTFFLVVSLLIYNFVPVKATEATLPSDFINYHDIMGLQDLGYALVGGAQFTFNDSQYVIEDYSSLSAAGKLEAEREMIKQFLHDYELQRGITYDFEEGALYQSQPYYTTAFTRNANNLVEEYTLNNSYSTYTMPMSPTRFADWAQYNRYWINRYSDSFTQDSSSDVVVDPDPNYSTYLNNINDTGFFWKSWPNNDGFGQTGALFSYPPSNVSWYSVSHNFPNSLVVGQLYYVFCFEYLTLDIYPTGENENYTCSITLHDALHQFHSGNDYYQYGILYQYSDPCFDSTGQNSFSPTTLTFNGGLVSVLNQISACFKNVNIRVNGEYWAYVGAGTGPANPVIPDFPDVIENEEDLAYDIPFPKNDTYSGTFDLTSLFDALKLAIIGASDNDNTTSGTLTGEAVTDSYAGDDVDVNDRVEDLTSTDVFVGTLEDSVTDRLPDIPVPPIGVHNGLAGATVLAKYIDATQCILPEELITVFWGGFFILIILGLIKNLHR